MFLTLWIIAGAFMGYIIPQAIIVYMLKHRTPATWDIAFAFVGGLVAYSLMR